MAESKHTCAVDDGTMLNPCDTLREAEADSHGGLGLHIQHRRDLITGEPARVLAVFKGGAFRKKGIALNWCPFCGTDLRQTYLGTHASIATGASSHAK